MANTVAPRTVNTVLRGVRFVRNTDNGNAVYELTLGRDGATKRRTSANSHAGMLLSRRAADAAPIPVTLHLTARGTVSGITFR